MRAATYYKTMLLLPLLAFVCNIPGDNRPSLFSDLQSWHLGTLLFVMPYLLTLVLHIRLIGWGTKERLQRLTWFLPLRLALVQIVLAGILGGSSQGSSGFASGIPWGIFLGTLSIIVGYIYMLCVNGIYCLLQILNVTFKSVGRFS